MSSTTSSGSTAPTVEVPGRGTRIDRFFVTTPVHGGRHAIVVQAREGDGSFVAIKLATTHVGDELIDREVGFLQLLDGHPESGPRLIGLGTTDGRRYCATRWIPGADVRVVASELREQGSSTQRLELCCRVARAYCALHSCGLLHGRVHPHHALVDGDGSLGLVDFSLAASRGDAPSAARLAARFHSLSAPEQAEALLLGEDPPLAPAAEQYSVSALLYLLITGRMYARLERNRRAMARDIVARPPLPFIEQGVAGLARARAGPRARAREATGSAIRLDRRARRGARAGGERRGSRLHAPDARRRVCTYRRTRPVPE